MPIPERLNAYIETDKQRHFQKDFLAGWEKYETWETANVGDSSPALRTFRMTQEDAVSYNKACGETDPLMIDIDYAKKNSPTGEILQHPLFVTTVGFYSVGEIGIGSWFRTPGSMNPGQVIEIIEPFKDGETITTTVTTVQKFMQRGKAQLKVQLEMHNENGVLKARWLAGLILPPTQSAVARFINA